MPKELIEIYNSLSEEKKREVFAFASFLKNYDGRAESEDDILKKSQNAFWELREYAQKNLPPEMLDMPMEKIDEIISEVRSQQMEMA